MQKITAWFTANFKLVGWVYCIAAIGTALQQYFISLHNGVIPNFGDTAFNNYLIFRASFFHLLHGQNLYLYYPNEHFDLYKYSPTFSIAFGLLAKLPLWLGLVIWNICNAMCLFWGIKKLPNLSVSAKCLMLWFCLIELVGSLQNSQSNALMAGLLIISFNLLESKKPFWAALCIVGTIFIKIYGVVGLVLFLFYPNKIKNIAYVLGWSFFLFFMPLIDISWGSLWQQYLNWKLLLSQDFSNSIGLSVMGWLETWFGFNPSKTLVILIGAALFGLPFIKIKVYNNYNFRLLTLTSVLIWMVVFNHKAESPTFIIAIAGVAIWFFSQPKSNINWTLFIVALVFTALSPTDLFPSYIKDHFFVPYVIKAVPCIFIWVKITLDLWKEKPQPLP